MEEVWKDVVGYEGHYQVSNLGRVKRIKSARGSQIGRIMQGSITSDGYLMVGLTINSNQKWFGVHTLVARAFISNPDNKPEVNHIDGNKLNNACYNLEWVSHQENMHHAWRNGLCHSPSEETRRKMSIAANNRSEEHRRKLSIAASNRTEEHRRKLGEAHKGKLVTAETRKKLSEAHKGIHPSEETRRKMSEARKEFWRNKKSKQ